MPDWSLNIPNELWLDLSGLTAEITIDGGAPRGSARITAVGDERLLAKLDLRHPEPAEVALDYGPGPIRISVRGKTTVAGVMSGGVSIMSGVRAKNIVIRNVVVNGVSVSASLGDSDDTFEVEALPIVAISLPAETILHLKAGGGSQLSVQGIGGRFRLAIDGSCDANLQDVRSPEIRIEGSGDVRLLARGDAKIAISGSGDCRGSIEPHDDGRPSDLEVGIHGSGDVDLRGRFGRARLSTAGSGDITLRGGCAELDASTAGSGDIKVRGKVAGPIRKREAGSGEVSVG